MISIIGSGKVGSAIAFLMASNALDDLVLINRTKSKALGEALDISNAIPSESSISVIGTDDFSKMKNSNVIIVSARDTPRDFTPFSNESRQSLSIISSQIKMLREITKKIQKYSPNSTVLMVSNPVDILTYVFHKESNSSQPKVIGVGSSIDSNRFRYLLSKELETNSSKITNTFVLGEHGDSMIPLFSLVKHDHESILNLLDENQIQKVTKNLQNYWRILREYNVRSIHGVAKETYDIAKSILNKKEISLSASVMLNGEFGISDVCIGVPIKLKKDETIEIQEINLSRFELIKLEKSAKNVKKFLKFEVIGKLRQ